MTAKPEIPLHIEDALTHLLDYLYVMEQWSYEEEPTTGHVFHSLHAIAEWIGWEE